MTEKQKGEVKKNTQTHKWEGTQIYDNNSATTTKQLKIYLNQQGKKGKARI